MKTILIATDGSEHADKALATAIDLAQALKARLHVVHVHDLDVLSQAERHLADVEFADKLKLYGSYLPGDTQAGYLQAGMREALRSVDTETAVMKQIIGDGILQRAKKKALEAGVAEVTTEAKTGDPAREILAAISESEADLVVMGRRGLGGVAELLLGSVSQKVLHQSPVSVLTVV